MADITIADLLQWERGLTFRPAAGATTRDGVDVPISWVVSVRATEPLLPSIRGGEIVVATPRTLARVEESGSFDRAAFLRHLARQPIAALMVEPSFSEDAVDGVPLLISSGTFPHDAENVLNRLLTERRAELYHLGSELSRSLSAAGMSGAGLDAVLDAAESITGRPLVLQNLEGVLLGSSAGAADVTPLPASAIADVAALTVPARRTDAAGVVWLTLPVRADTLRAGSRASAVLSVRTAPGASTEADRLVLTQTAASVELLLGQASGAGQPPPGRGNREALVLDLLLGRLTSREAADARARLIGLDPAQRARVALVISAAPQLAARVRPFLADERRRITTALADDELAVVLPSDASIAADWRDLTAMHRALRQQDDSAVLVLSEPVAGPARVHAALEQTRLLARLVTAGVLDGPALRADEPDRTGLLGLFLPLVVAGDLEPESVRARLEAFATTLLGPLEEHDQRRGSELVPTLAAYLRLGGALAQAAEDLDIHRNTLSYRLGRIAELTGRDLNDPGTRFLLQVALSIRALERALA